MSKITNEELLRIAELSVLRLTPQEQESFVGQIDTILEFASQLAQVSSGDEAEITRNVNVFRDDKIIRKENDLLLDGAAQREDNYFVVPQILDEK
jgi:aspartyl-tRNA(Asn)/glutamyl-tRNA(Gln) amidotransferase subunit C